MGSFFPEGRTRQRAFESVMNRWAQNDPYAAGSWLEFGAGRFQRCGGQMYTQRIAESDPAAAVQWVQTINDTDMRNNRLESLRQLAEGRCKCSYRLDRRFGVAGKNENAASCRSVSLRYV